MAGDLMNIQGLVKADIQLWFTAQEFADASKSGVFVGLPTDKRNIDRMIARENWQRYHALVKVEKGRGGIITRYHINLLPLDVRIAYFSRFISAEGAELASPLPLPGGADLTERARLSRDAKMLVLRMVDRFQRMSGLASVAADDLFAQMFNAGRVQLPDWASETVGKISPRTLARWRAAAREAGADALGHDPSLARKGTGILETANEGAVKLSILGWLVNHPALAAEELRDLIEDEYGDELVDRNGELRPLPEVRAFQYYLKELKAVENVVLTKITDPDGYKSRLKLRGTGSYSWVSEMNQLWMIDASPGDALCVDGRHSIYVCIDVATRDLVITVSKTPRASAVGLMMRKAILHRGVCHQVKTDNGSDFVAQESQRLFASLKIDVQRSKKFTPEEKAFVERAIKTVQHKFFSGLPGYIGHSVADRKVIEGRKSFAKRLGQGPIETFEVSLTAEQLQQKLDDWLEHKYRHRKHGGLGGRTPAQAMAATMATVRTVDERALDILLMPVVGKNGLRKMTAQGIEIEGEFYLSGSILPGTDLFVRLDPMDMGNAYAFSANDGRFLDVATCAKFAKVSRAAFVKAKKQDLEDLVSDRQREIEAAARKQQKGPAAMDRIINLAKRKSAERAADTANVVTLPKRSERYSTPALDAALDAATWRPDSEPKPLTDAQRRRQEAVERELSLQPISAPAGATPLRTSETPQQRFRRWLDVDRRYVAGEQLASETLVALGEYKAGREWKVQMAMRELEEASNGIGDQAPVSRP